MPPNDLAHPSLDADRLERQRKAGWVKGRVQRLLDGICLLPIACFRPV